jgi:hypothetical protein
VPKIAGSSPIGGSKSTFPSGLLSLKFATVVELENTFLGIGQPKSVLYNLCCWRCAGSELPVVSTTSAYMFLDFILFISEF